MSSGADDIFFMLSYKLIVTAYYVGISSNSVSAVVINDIRYSDQTFTGHDT